MYSKAIILCFMVTLASCYVSVPKCESKVQAVANFFYINGTQDDTTKAYLCHDEENLVIKWVSFDEQIISEYKNCNDPLYNEDAVEVFIATPESYPLQYFELELSPKSVLFFADITNPQGSCSGLQTKYEDCDLAKYNANIITGKWQAELKIGFDIIGRSYQRDTFMINLLRIDKSSSKPTRFLCWQPTLTNPACFHVPKYFMEIRMQ